MIALSVNEPNVVTYHPRSWDSCLYKVTIMNLVRDAGILSLMNSWWPWPLHCPLGPPLEQNPLCVMWPYLAYPLQHAHAPQPLYSSLYLCQSRRGISISLLSAYPGFWEPLQWQDSPTLLGPVFWKGLSHWNSCDPVWYAHLFILYIQNWSPGAHLWLLLVCMAKFFAFFLKSI